MIDPTIHGLSFVAHLSYIGIFFVVALSGYAIPIPEELILLLGGYLSALHVLNIFIVLIVCVFGAVCGDSLIYYLAGHGSRFTQKYHKRVEGTHAGWYMRQMRKNPSQTIFLSRFVVGFRFLNPLVAGLMGVPWSTFLPSTFFSALLYSPVIILLGYVFHRQITRLIRITELVRHDIIILLIIGTILLIVLFFKNLVEQRRSA